MEFVVVVADGKRYACETISPNGRMNVSLMLCKTQKIYDRAKQNVQSGCFATMPSHLIICLSRLFQSRAIQNVDMTEHRQHRQWNLHSVPLIFARRHWRCSLMTDKSFAVSLHWLHRIRIIFELLKYYNFERMTNEFPFFLFFLVSLYRWVEWIFRNKHSDVLLVWVVLTRHTHTHTR